MFNKFCKSFYICCKKISDFTEDNYEKIRNFIIGFHLILLAAAFFWIFFAIVGLKFSLLFLSIIVAAIVIDLIYEKGKKAVNKENKGSEKNV